MLSGELRADRTTSDCDVVETTPAEHWESVAAAAAEVAGELGLKPDWLNRHAAMFAWQLPLGWRNRCRRHHDFGPLRVMVLSRGDLMAAKVMSAGKRVQDRDDLVAMRPTAEELDTIAKHLDRVESESETGQCDVQRATVSWLRTLR